MWQTIQGLELPHGLVTALPAYALSLIGLTVVGLLLGLLRLHSNGVGAPVAAHWVAVVPPRAVIWLAG
jgi:hypothetical protein